jgi:hypothetical protein
MMQTGILLVVGQSRPGGKAGEHKSPKPSDIRENRNLGHVLLVISVRIVGVADIFCSKRRHVLVTVGSSSTMRM